MVKRTPVIASKEAETQFILLSRFHTDTPNQRSPQYSTYDSIGKVINKSASYVRSVCFKAIGLPTKSNTLVLKETRIREKTKLLKRKTFGTLTSEHIAELTCQETLKKDAGFSLRVKTEKFNALHPEVKISPNKLFNVYKSVGIKYKMITMTKILKKQHARRVNKAIKSVYDQVQEARSIKAPIVFVDEVMFTRQTHNKRAYSNMYETIKMDLSRNTGASTAVIAAISENHGVLLQRQYQRSVNIDKFISFLSELRRKLRARPIYLFMDNLSVHRSETTLAHMEKLGIVPIFNAPYSPQYNPIELTFSMVKRVFKDDMTNRMVSNSKIQIKQMIDQAFATVTKMAVKNQIRHSMKLLLTDSQIGI